VINDVKERGKECVEDGKWKRGNNKKLFVVWIVNRKKKLIYYSHYNEKLYSEYSTREEK
jgi:hypothetical protein